MNQSSQSVAPDRANAILLFATFIIAICGLIYELLAGAISSYLLGDSVFQFSLVIGLFLASMGVGSFLSRYVGKALAETFIVVQCVIALSGGFSAYLLFFAFSHLENYQPFLYLVCFVVGTLVGLEIPIVIRLLKTYRILRLNVSNVLTADYIGALAASLAFPLVLVPQLGLFRTALLFGLLNCFVAGLGLYVFTANIRLKKTLFMLTSACAALLVAGFFLVNTLTNVFQNRLYTGEVIFSKQTPYQNIVLTRDGPVISLFLNGQLQFNTLDEYRYHESLVHPAMSMAGYRQRVLVLGGGDGMAVREILKYPDVDQITLVDLDSEITRLFRDNPLLASLNSNALQDNRLQIVNTDAWKFLEQDKQLYNVIIIDLPDPHDISISKLYTRAFYSLVMRHLAADGIVATQATSPMYAREAFWCIAHTLADTPSPFALDDTLNTLPYHSYVPTFGEWGFVLASARTLHWENIQLPQGLHYLDDATLTTMPVFAPDMAEVPTDLNALQTHKLVRYYEQGWKKWFH
jgi:spermidine synthase